ncbi:MAG: putative lipid II flippase FtsW [Clostridia bacterium]|nr:putative lipid II flippase FtsW [Clostridia bacterium]
MAKKAVRRKKLRFLQEGKLDITFLSFILVILTVGLVMLYSASYAYSHEYYGNSYKFISKQLLFAVAGVVLMLGISKVNYHYWRKCSWLIFGISIALLVVLLILPPMVSGMDVKRWFVVGPVNFQPSEVAKFAVILLFSSLISANHDKMKNWRFILFLVGILGLTCVLVVLEPHLSATILIFVIGIVLLIVGGIPKLWIIAGAGAGAGLGALAIFSGLISYGSDRIKYWLDPWLDPSNKGYQTIQSLLAIGSGGILGRGIGQSRQKYLWVPEPHNDFIFAIVCEELGLIGAMVIIILFALLMWRGFTIAMRAPDKFGSLMAVGLTFQVGLQAMLNIWVVTNTIPNTGIGLPFFSYGGSSLILLLAQMGIILSISRAASLQKQ